MLAQLITLADKDKIISNNKHIQKQLQMFQKNNCPVVHSTVSEKGTVSHPDEKNAAF